MPLVKARRDCSEAKLMIRPQPFFRMPGTSAWARKNGTVRLSAMVRSQPSGVTWSAWLAQIEPGGIDQDLGRTEGFGGSGRDRGDVGVRAKIGRPGWRSDHPFRHATR
jgi:hypothetical protein